LLITDNKDFRDKSHARHHALPSIMADLLILSRGTTSPKVDAVVQDEQINPKLL
jgi:hypothetical protein